MKTILSAMSLVAAMGSGSGQALRETIRTPHPVGCGDYPYRKLVHSTYCKPKKSNASRKAQRNARKKNCK